MAPPPRRGPLPPSLQGKVDGKDFQISPHKVDHDGNNFVDWGEFTRSLVANYLAVFYGSTDQSPWIIRLNANDWKEKEIAKSVRIMFGNAEAEVEGAHGRRSKIGVGRTFIISDDEQTARALIQKNFPNRKDIAVAKSERAAKAALEQRLRANPGNEKVIDGTVKITLTPK